MELFQRSKDRIKTTSKIKHTSELFFTKDLYINKVILIHFSMGQEIFYYVQKHENKNYTGKIYSSKELELVIAGVEKVLSIELCSLKSSQFKSEQKAVENYIQQGRCS